MLKYIAALMLASTLIATDASATITVSNNGLGKRDDFQITFDSPPGPLRQTITGDNFKTDPSDPNTVVSSGWTVNGLGSPDNSLTIEGLGIYKLGLPGLAGAQVLSWCWSLGNDCPAPGDRRLPTVRFDDQNYTLPALSLAGYGVFSVPEPSSWLTMICGFAAMGMVLRRRPRDIVPA